MTEVLRRKEVNLNGRKLVVEVQEVTWEIPGDYPYTKRFLVVKTPDGKQVAEVSLVWNMKKETLVVVNNDMYRSHYQRRVGRRYLQAALYGVFNRRPTHREISTIMGILGGMYYPFRRHAPEG